MRKSGRVVVSGVAIALLILSVGCATTGGTSVEEFQAMALASLDAYGEALMRGDVETWVALHDDDVIKMPQDQPAIVGKAAMKKNIEAGLAAVEFVDFGTDSREFVVFGDYGYVRGDYYVEQRLRANGTMLPRFEGKYFTVYRRQPDGGWKIFRDSYSSNLPPAG